MKPTATIKYNPAFLTEKELIESYVVRQSDLELILEVIRESGDNNNQHIIVVAARGAGKTTLVLRTAAEIRRNNEFSEKWFPVVFAEESYEVCSAGEFWLEAIFHIAEQTENEQLKLTYKELKKEINEDRLRERALSQLLDFSDQQNKRLLLVVENLNMLLGDQISTDDSWKLRHTLLNEPRIMVLGTATSRFEQIDNSENAMFDLFKIHDLKPLDTKECQDLWESVTGQRPSLNRIKPIKILTGGSPRLLVIISSFAAKKSFKELMEDLTKLVDEHTEYFKSHLDNLPPLERKVFVSLADIWHPATAKEVSESARINVNKASAYLQRLISKGAVVVADKKGRKKWYQLSERMYNIYHLMRRRGEPSSRVRAIVDFMIHFYVDDDLIHLTNNVINEACHLEPEICSDHFIFIKEILQKPQVEKFRDKIIENIPKHIIDTLELEVAQTKTHAPILTEEEIKTGILNNPDDTLSLLTLVVEIIKNYPDRLEEARAACEKSIKINSNLELPWILLGILNEDDPKNYQNSENAYQQAIKIDPDCLPALNNLGDLLSKKSERHNEAEKTFRKAIEIDPDYTPAWISLGNLLSEKKERHDEAEKAFRKAIEIDPDDSQAWIRLGDLLSKKSERHDEAEKAFRRAIEIDPDDSQAWIRLGDLLSKKSERHDEAEKAFRKAIEIDPDDSQAWIRLGILLSEKRERHHEAEKAFRKAIEIDPNLAPVWGMLGSLLSKSIDRHNEAEEAFSKAIDINPNIHPIWTLLGNFLSKKERYDEAERALRKAIDINPNFAPAWGMLGSLLSKNLDRHNEAEKAYNIAIELNPEFQVLWINLFELQYKTLNNPKRALKTAEKYLKSNNRSVQALNSLAWCIYENKYNNLLNKAEEWSREAVQKNELSSHIKHSLASILGRQEKWDESLKLAQQFLKDDDIIKKGTKEITDYFITAAASGNAKKALEILKQYKDNPTLEPITIGLKIFIGEEFITAQEIKEIGEDVAKRIHEQIDK